MNDTVVFIVDLETTTNDKHIADIVQLGCVLLEENGTVTPLIQTYVKPDSECTEEAFKVHGIGEDKYWISPPQEKVLMTLALLVEHYKYYGFKVLLGGFNSSKFDIPIINRISPKSGFLELPQLDIICYGQRMFPELENHKLGTVHTHLFPDEMNTQFRSLAHDAVADCLMVSQIINKVKEEYRVSLNDLQTWCTTPYVLQICHFGKNKGKPWSKVPKTYLKWIRDTWDDKSIDLEATLTSLGS